MDLNGMNNMFSFISLFFGAYCFYAWYQLKDGTIPNKFMLLSQDLSPEKCLDPEYYAAYMRPRLLIFGAIMVVAGVIGMLDVRYDFFATVFGDFGNTARLLVVSVIPFLAVVWFGVCLYKIQKELW